MNELQANLKKLYEITGKLASKKLSQADRKGYEAWANELRAAINAAK